MVRVPTGEYTWIARALDIGARGVMVPMVESRAQAERLAQSCRYPGVGRRGAAHWTRHAQPENNKNDGAQPENKTNDGAQPENKKKRCKKTTAWA